MIRNNVHTQNKTFVHHVLTKVAQYLFSSNQLNECQFVLDNRKYQEMLRAHNKKPHATRNLKFTNPLTQTSRL